MCTKNTGADDFGILYLKIMVRLLARCLLNDRRKNGVNIDKHKIYEICRLLGTYNFEMCLNPHISDGAY